MKNEIRVKEERLEGMENSFSESSEELVADCQNSSFEKEENDAGKTSSEAQKLELSISASLHRKLSDKARQEGVSLSELTSELLAEGLVLRAWEIMERKSAMKAPSPQGQGSRVPRQSYNRSNNNNNSNNSSYSPSSSAASKGKYRSGGNNSFQGKNQKRYKFSHQDMGDNANFIEYVRSQEKKNPW